MLCNYGTGVAGTDANELLLKSTLLLRLLDLFLSAALLAHIQEHWQGRPYINYHAAASTADANAR